MFHQRTVVKEEPISEDECYLPDDVVEAAIKDVYFSQKKCSSWFRDRSHDMYETIQDLKSGKIDPLAHVDNCVLLHVLQEFLL